MDNFALMTKHATPRSVIRCLWCGREIRPDLRGRYVHRGTERSECEHPYDARMDKKERAS